MKGATQIATKKIELDEYKPGSAIAKFISKNFKFAKQQNKSVLAPKLIYIPKKTMDEKAMKSGRYAKLKDLQQKYKSIDTENAAERIKIRNEFNKVKDEKREYFQDIIDLDQMNFLVNLEKEFSKSSVDTPLLDQIRDPTLRGLIDIAEKTKFKNHDEFKQIIDATIPFIKTKSEFELIKSVFKSQLADIPKFQVKVFNIVFDHPKQTGNTNVYLLKSYQHFTEILKLHIKQSSEKEIVEFVLENEKVSQEFKSLVSKHYNDETNDWMKEYKPIDKKQLRELQQHVLSAVSCDKFLSKFDLKNLKDKFDDYVELVEKIKKIETLSDSEKTVQDFVKRFVKVLTQLRSIDPREEKKKDAKGNEVYTEKLDTTFYKDLVSIVPLNISKNTKKRLFDCVYQKSNVEFVEFEQDKKEKHEFKIGQFELSEFEILVDPTIEFYNIKNYAKFGNLIDIKVSKHIRAAIGIRIIAEVMKEINKLELYHGGKDTFTIQLTC